MALNVNKENQYVGTCKSPGQKSYSKKRIYSLIKYHEHEHLINPWK